MSDIKQSYLINFGWRGTFLFCGIIVQAALGKHSPTRLIQNKDQFQKFEISEIKVWTSARTVSIILTLVDNRLFFY